MQISFANLLLASGDLALGRAGPSGLRINGRQLNQEVELPRAAALAVIARGNRRNAVSFSVVRVFPTLGLAGVFRSTQLNQLPLSGALVFTDSCGADQTTSTLMCAALVSADAEQLGVSVVVTYNFLGGTFTSSTAVVDGTGLAPITTANGVQAVNSGGSLWLQFMDQGTFCWVTAWLKDRVFTTGASVPQGTVAVRVQLGFLQLWDTVDLCWRSIWWNGEVLEVGPVDNSAANPTYALTAAAMRLYPGGAGWLLQLSDQASPGQFRTMIITNGALSAGPLTS